MADLITLDEYKLAQGLTSLKDDDRITSLISAASQMVKTYCARDFVDFYATPTTQTFSVTFETDIIQLRECPVQAIVKVEERSSYGSSYVALTTGGFEYYLDPMTDSLIRTTESTCVDWAMGPGSVVVEYTGGYASIPEDLKLAVIDLVKYYLKEEYKERRTISGASISNVTTSSQWRNVEFPDHIKRVLDLYKQLNL